MHVWFANGKGVDIRLVVEVGKTVVDEAVSALVTANRIEDVEEFGVCLQAPVVLCNLRSWEILPEGSFSRAFAI